MNSLGILLAGLSGTCNGLFTTPMKMQPDGIGKPVAGLHRRCVPGHARGNRRSHSSRLDPTFAASATACFIGGAICFGQSVDSLGVSIANSLVIGLSALGSLVLLFMNGHLEFGLKVMRLLSGIAGFLIGLAFAGRLGCFATVVPHRIAKFLRQRFLPARPLYSANGWRPR